MTTTRSAVFVLVIAAILAVGTTGCSSKAKSKSTPETTPTAAETAPPPVEAPPTPPAEPFPPQPVEKTTVDLSIEELNRQGVLKTVHFAFNSNDLDDVATTILKANAEWLKAHPKYKVEIGGHCDDRGSIGYNVALGDRRANAVKDYLVNLAVSGSMLVAISYGEEKPVDPAQNEAAWAKNRRADFTIKP